MLKQYAIFLCLFAASVLGQSAVHSFGDLGLNEVARLWPYQANSISSSGVEKVYPYIIGDEVVFLSYPEVAVSSKTKLKHKDDKLLPYSVVRAGSELYAISLSRGIGRFVLGQYSMITGKSNKQIEFHQPGFVHNLKSLNDETMVLSGFMMTGYGETLDRYDENTITPSQKSIDAFKSYFDRTQTYTLAKIDKNLIVVDSANFLQRRGEDMECFVRMFSHIPTDVSDGEEIYTINANRSYSVNVYDLELEYLSTIDLSNPKYLEPPKDLTKEKQVEIMSKRGVYSQVYALFVTEKYVVTSFYQNPGGHQLPEPPYFVDITTKEGVSVLSTQIEYPLYSRRGEALYLFVMVESTSMFRGDEYYLVPLSIEELIAGEVQKKNIKRKIAQGG